MFSRELIKDRKINYIMYATNLSANLLQNKTNVLNFIVTILTTSTNFSLFLINVTCALSSEEIFLRRHFSYYTYILPYPNQATSYTPTHRPYTIPLWSHVIKQALQIKQAR